MAVINLGSNNVSIFKNNSTLGSISISTKTDFSIATSSSPYSIATGDIDGDGLVDMITSNLGLNTISIFRNKMRSFYVAGQGPNYHGSYMILENADKPYLVEIQGFDGYLSPRYSTDLNEWRSRAVFALAPKDIRSIRVEYPSEMLNSFTIENASTKPTTPPPI